VAFFDVGLRSYTEAAGGLEIIGNKTANICQWRTMKASQMVALAITSSPDPNRLRWWFTCAVLTPSTVAFHRQATSREWTRIPHESSIIQISGVERASQIVQKRNSGAGSSGFRQNTGNALVTDGTTVNWSTTAGSSL